MKMLLLVAAATLLASSAFKLPPCRHDVTDNLKQIIDLKGEINEMAFEHVFVEDVGDLADNGCKNDFFCKVQNILHHYRSENKTAEEKPEREKVENIVTNLDIYTTCTKMNCTAILTDVPKSGVSSQLHVLLGHLERCIQLRNSLPVTSTSAASTVRKV